MDTSAKKSFEVQAQIRHNAAELKSTLSDLYSWEKEIKEKEQNLNRHPPPTNEVEHLKTLPVRSQVATKAAETHTKQGAKVEKQLINGNKPVEETRNLANEYKDRGNKHVKLGEYEKAIHEYTGAIKMYDKDPIFYTNRALCYLKMEKYDDCIEDCEHAIRLDGLVVKAYYRRMQANECLGNNMDALKDCTAVLMIEPKNVDAKRSLERINERLRKTTAKSPNGPNFSTARTDFIDILPIEKPPYKRSNKPLLRVPIADVVGPKDTKNYQNSKLQISDEELDKIFNSNCGSYVEVKKKETDENFENDILETKKTKASTENKTSADNKNKEIINTGTSNSASTSSAPNLTQQKQSNRIHESSKSLTTTSANFLPQKATRSLPPVPATTAQFYSNWKELTAVQKYEYLKSIELPNLCKILGAGFDSDTLTDILHTLKDYYVPQQNAALASTLLEVSKNSQVGILSLLMSTDERKALTDILNSMKENDANVSADMTKQIALNFNLH